MNVPPNKAPTPDEIGQLNRSATDWLRKNDPKAKLNAFKARKKREKAAKQARENPALVNAYRKALTKAR